MLNAFVYQSSMYVYELRSFDCAQGGLTAPIVFDITTKNEINAHSPRYSMNNGRVESMKAGSARIAVARPVLMEYLRSGCRRSCGEEASPFRSW